MNKILYHFKKNSNIVSVTGIVHADLTVGIARLMYHIPVMKMPRYTKETRREMDLPILQIIEHRSNKSCKTH
jgi:hypothetical protein